MYSPAMYNSILALLASQRGELHTVSVLQTPRETAPTVRPSHSGLRTYTTTGKQMISK